jgi:hypothetical protein
MVHGRKDKIWLTAQGTRRTEKKFKKRCTAQGTRLTEEKVKDGTRRTAKKSNWTGSTGFTGFLFCSPDENGKK